MNPVLKALMAGYGINQIVDFISNAIPGMGSKISKARNSGYSTEQIMNFISQTMDNEKYPKNMTANEIHALKSQKYGDMTKKAAGAFGAIGLGALGAGVASMAGDMGSSQQENQSIKPSAILPPLPNSPMQGQKGIGFNPMQLQQQPPQQLIGNTVQPPSPGPQPSPAPGMPNAPTGQTPNIPPGQVPQEPPTQNPIQAQDSAKILDQMGIKEHVDTMLLAGNDPMSISKVIGRYRKIPTKDLPQIEQVITDYAQSLQPEQQSQQLIKPTQNIQVEPEVNPEIKEPVKERKPRESEKYHLSPSGKIEEIEISAKRGIKGQKPLPKMTYEDLEKGLTPSQKKSFETIDKAIKKTSKHLLEGKDFSDLLGNMSPKTQLSTAEDVLRLLAGMPSKYDILDDEEKEEIFNTFQGLTPNIVWNTISLIDPNIQNIKRPLSPKGSKAGREEMSPSDFRRYLAHSVNTIMERDKKFGEKAEMVTNVIDAISSFKSKKNRTMEIQNLTDDELMELFNAIEDEEVEKFR